MECKECGSDKLTNFTGEVAVHFPGLEGLSKPIVWVFPRLAICLVCGSTNFVVPDEQLRQLIRGSSSSDAEAGEALRN